MDQHHNCSQPDILGLANMSLLTRGGSRRHNDHAKVVGEIEKSLKRAISEEEMKIRREIEREVERDLEEEIKGGIYQQALRLHRLYQNRKQERPANIQPPENSKKLLEVNISIRVEGGTKVEIKETKKETPGSYSRPRTSRSDTTPQTLLPVAPNTQRTLDWVKSLRSGAAHAVVRKNVVCYRSRMPVAGNHQGRCHRAI